jgi:hypothetical protein
MGLLLMFLVGIVTYTIGEHYFLLRIPAAMLGKWTVIDGQYSGATVEFLRDGTMRSTLKTGQRIEGQIRSDGVNVWVTTRDPNTAEETTDTLELLELSPSFFVTQNDAGDTLIMKRAQ